MKPASTHQVGREARRSLRASASSKASRVAKACVIDHRGGDAARGREGQARGIGPVAITATTRAVQPCSAQRSTIACMLEPRPEMRMTMRFMAAGSVGAAERRPRT